MQQLPVKLWSIKAKQLIDLPLTDTVESADAIEHLTLTASAN
jgi:hypothetical protein